LSKMIEGVVERGEKTSRGYFFSMKIITVAAIWWSAIISFFVSSLQAAA